SGFALAKRSRSKRRSTVRRSTASLHGYSVGIAPVQLCKLRSNRVEGTREHRSPARSVQFRPNLRGIPEEDSGRRCETGGAALSPALYGRDCQRVLAKLAYKPVRISYRTEVHERHMFGSRGTEGLRRSARRPLDPRCRPRSL